MHQQQTAFENIVGKGEIAHKEQFLPFPQCFLLNQIIVSPFVHIFDTISLFATELEEPKIGISGRGLNCYLPHFSFAQQKALIGTYFSFFFVCLLFCFVLFFYPQYT